MDPLCSLENDKAVRTLSQYRYIPIHSIGVFPAQLLLPSLLHGFLPSKSFLKILNERMNASQFLETNLHQRNVRVT